MMGRNAQRGMDVLEAIMAAGIEIHAQIVLCPGMNDGEELEKTLRFCEEHEQITSLGIVPLGFTKHQNRFSWSYSDKPELALTIQREDGFYAARTCLTLDMAYNNARLICRPETSWIKR